MNIVKVVKYMQGRLFQVIEKKQIRQTRDNSGLGILVKWITEIVGIEEAMKVQGWSEICDDGEYYEGEHFEVICLGW